MPQMHGKLSPVSNGTSPDDEADKSFKPPGITDLASLADGRKPGNWHSKYSFSAWVQITFEGIYLNLLLFGSIYLLIKLIKRVLLGPPHTFAPWLLGDAPVDSLLYVWTAAALGGACGGCSSALKWLYHSVAKQHWHCDRIVWRMIVPILAGVLAVFSLLMIASGLVPILNKTSFESPASGAAFGFFVGLFSDNLLASLQRLAHNLFGTVDSKPTRGSELRDNNRRNDDSAD
jgi:hypothetical protein